MGTQDVVSAGVNNTPLTRACQIAESRHDLPPKSAFFPLKQPLENRWLISPGAAKIIGQAEIRSRLELRFVANLRTQENTDAERRALPT
jgi:hypothetical protein